jgi:post-segregation antitoxin (ccd killing protein)
MRKCTHCTGGIMRASGQGGNILANSARHPRVEVVDVASYDEPEVAAAVRRTREEAWLKANQAAIDKHAAWLDRSGMETAA